MSLSRPWDDFDAYLFDIDGTLIHCADAVHYFAFCDVLSSVGGRPLNLDGVRTHGNTDVGILRDAFATAGIAEGIWRYRLSELRERLCLRVEEQKGNLCVKVLPQVREVLSHLRSKGAVLSIATGNLERVGKQKLAAAGILDQFHMGTWSDAFEYRVDVLRYAVEQIRCNTHRGATVLAIGDTPADIIAAKSNHLPVIAVATGVYTYDQLTAHEPSLCIHSMADLLQPCSLQHTFN